MRKPRLLLAATLAAAFASGLSPGQMPPIQPLAELGGVVLGSGPTSSSLSLYHVPELGVLPVTSPGSGPFQFLAFDLTTRFDFLRFDASRPRRVQTDDGLVRVVLPNGSSVFHYRRGTSTFVFGWLLVEADGESHFLLERRGFGPGGTQDPFHAWLAASRDGSRLAVHTRLLAGGDLFLLSGDGDPLPSGTTSVEVASAGALDILPESVTFANGAFFFVATNLLRRVDTTAAAPSTTVVALPPSGGAPPAFLVEEMAVSENGEVLIVLGGPAEKNVDLYVVTAAGAATNLTQSSAEYLPPGYEPYESHGPYLALSSDGSRVMYIEDVNDAKELFIRDVVLPTPVHVTSDAWFDISIDNPGSLGSVIPPTGEVVFIAGTEHNGVDADVYAASATGLNLTVQNLSGTGGVTPPFPSVSTLNLLDIFQIEGSANVVAILAKPTGQDLVSVGATGLTTLLSASGPIGPLAGPAKGRVFFAAKPIGGLPTIYVLDGSSGTPTLQSLHPAVTSSASFLALTPTPSGEEVAAIESFGPGNEIALRIDVVSGSASSMLPIPASFVRGFAWTPFEHLVFAAGLSPTGPFYPIFDVVPGLCVPISVMPGSIALLR